MIWKPDNPVVFIPFRNPGEKFDDLLMNVAGPDRVWWRGKDCWELNRIYRREIWTVGMGPKGWIRKVTSLLQSPQ